MNVAYLDTSFLLAILFGEPGAARLQGVLGGFDRVLASDVLVAEALAATKRERVDAALLHEPLERIDLVLPTRSLEHEMHEALSHGSLRGADLWHVACAAFVAGRARGDLAFLTRDRPQRAVARALGFPTP